MKFTHTLALSLLIVLTGGVSLVFAWTGPTQTPPGGNVSPPINTSASNQVKNGGLGVNSLAVYGSAIISGVSKYLNFGTIAGVTGYGIRDNAGKMEVKDVGGVWSRLATTTSTGSFPQITFSDGTVQTTAASGGAAYQTFNSSGTWTKPSTGTVAFVECWGGGGGSTAYAGGGGGGYNSRTFPLATLTNSVSVTIGGGGAYNGYLTGGGGGTSSFGQYLFAYGGGGADWALGGGGGGQLSAGGGADGAKLPGRPRITATAFSQAYSIDGTSGYTTGSCMVGQGGGNECAAQDGYIHGGGGGGGSSVYGGGGGGSPGGGSSQFGGRGGNSGQPGVQPGGGGGAAGGSGAAGRCNVVVW